MIKLDLTKIEDIAKCGVLLSNDQFPLKGSNYIREDGTREHYALFADEAKNFLINVDETKEYKAAYLLAMFIDEARKQVPLIQHRLPNDKEILIPANMPKHEILRTISKL
ncbi:MAG: hypothetical protein E7079_08170 [Bacteroidales bacterium]|nr:hypothetical protein [Bacteroidales bacterium]